MNNIVNEYLEGIWNSPKNKKLTPSLLCKFLAKDPSSLKRSRVEKYPYLQIVFDEIDHFNEEIECRQKSEDPVAHEKRLKEKYKNERDDFKRRLKESYAREVVQINRIDEQDRALEMYEKDSSLKLAKPRM